MRIITSDTTNSPKVIPTLHTDNKYLNLIACGRYILNKTNCSFKCIRPADECKNFMIQLLLAGRGKHIINGKEIILKQSQCILYEPNQPQHIIHQGTDDVDIIWLHFSGYGVDEIISSLNLKGISTLNNTSGFKKMLLQMTQELATPSKNSDLICQNYLLNFLLTLSQRKKGNVIRVLSSSKIEPALNHMTNNYAKRSLSIHEYAQMCYISDSRFSHLFREVTGTTPHKYIELKRITNAKVLLADSDIKISEIASSVGFEDPYHFSRVFKKNTGISPTAYKHQLQSLPIEKEGDGAN